MLCYKSYCTENQLTTLDASNNKVLTGLDCSPMNVDGKNVLTTLTLKNGQNITKLNKPSGTDTMYVDCNWNKLSTDGKVS